MGADYVKTMPKKKIAVICSSRATYGYKRRIIKLIEESSNLELQIIATGMHLLPEYGYSLKEIEKDWFNIQAKVDMYISGDTPTAWAKSLGVELESLAQVFDMLKPDLLLVTGDRAEMFIGAVCASYMNIPIGHIQGGDVSGHIDGIVRHSITKLAHLHFTTCDDSKKRVLNLGEEPWRVFNTGAPQLDDILENKNLTVEKLKEIIGLDFSQKVLVVLFHPVLNEIDSVESQMKNLMEAIKSLGMPILVIWPNIDAGNKEITQILGGFQGSSFIKVNKNLERSIFISILAKAAVLVGNSSTGILEAPSFNLPVVNIGTRQRGRLRACNVIDVGYTKEEIVNGVKKALFNETFRENLINCVNPYGDGKSSQRIVKILEDIEISEKLLDKKITY